MCLVDAQPLGEEPPERVGGHVGIADGTVDRVDAERPHGNLTDGRRRYALSGGAPLGEPDRGDHPSPISSP